MSESKTVRTVTARPFRSAWLGIVSATLVLAVFVVVALVMKHDNAGAHFVGTDQIATVLIGVILAGLLIMPTRPRLQADADSVRLRSFLGGWRVVPWDLIVRIDFPKRVRFARIVLPGEETLAIYAVQRWDRERAVESMRELRALYATMHAQE